MAIPLPALRIGASKSNEAIHRALLLSRLHRELVWTDPITGETGRGLTALLHHVQQLQTGDDLPLESVPEHRYQQLVAESESWLVRKCETCGQPIPLDGFCGGCFPASSRAHQQLVKDGVL